MDFLNRFFNPEKIECPRCLGKGKVDWEDIRRLGKTLKWIPGTCAYCQGHGVVNRSLLSKLAVDSTYLTTNISENERDRLIAQDDGALFRADDFEDRGNKNIIEIEHLAFVCGLTASQITDFYFIHQESSATSEEDRAEFRDYVKKVISPDGGGLV